MPETKHKATQTPPEVPEKRATSSIVFDIWGCRGSRNLLPARSKIGNCTSSYSLSQGNVLFALDAGRGLTALSAKLFSRGRLSEVRHVVVLVSHSHLDHWEGIKDAEWFWRRENGISLTICGPAEALRAVEDGLRHPSFVPLRILSQGTLSQLEFLTLREGHKVCLHGWDVEPFALHHYSGSGNHRQFLDALGYRVTVPSGPTIAYLCDHEPTKATRAQEEAALLGTSLALYDAHFPHIKEQTFGHGSIEHAGIIARDHSDKLILAGHLNPRYSDSEVRRFLQQHGRGTPNLRIAIENQRYTWDGKRFRR